MPKNIRLDQVDIWFQDESRVGQQGAITRIWAPKGTRPRAVRQQQFEYAYIYGAVCPAQQQAIGLVLPSANSLGMALHLDAISQEIPEGRHGVIVVDGAPWHSERLDLPANITLLKLPPYSPELNPVEQVWQLIKQRWLSNRCYSGYEDIVDACCSAWNLFCKDGGLIQSLCSRKWIDIQ